MPSEVNVMPSWHAARYWDRSSSWRSTKRAPRLPSSASLLDPRAADAHERELRGHEEAVEQHEHDDGQQQQDGHRRSVGARAGAPLLRELSSSFIRRRGTWYPGHGASMLPALAHILSRMRIVSLVPSATEMLFALGVGDEVTAVTHECDHPPEALELPKVTRDVIGPGLPPDEIDRAVRALTEQGRAIYELDEDGAARASSPT